MAPHLKSGGEPGVSPPANAGNIIRFSVGPVHCQQHIRNLSSQRSSPVNRRLADVTVQKNLVALNLLALVLHKIHFPGKNRQHQSVFLFLVAVVGAELSKNLNHFSLIILGHINQPLRNHNRDDVIGFT